MDSAAAQFYAQIGYPSRLSLLTTSLRRGFSLGSGSSDARLDLAAAAVPESGIRLVAALEMLFSVCEQLRDERMRAGIAAFDAAPVLLFDEAQDLLKDARLKAAGGELVFQALGTLLVAYGVDRQAVRTIVAGSSAELNFAFSASTPARGNRWSFYTLGDPSPGAVTCALKERGYSGAEAAAMLELCGTRLRLLHMPLVRGAAAVSASTFLAETAEAGRAAFAAFFFPLDAESARQLAGILEAVAAADRGGSGGIATPRPTKGALPATLQNADLATVLYVDSSYTLVFQSQLHARTWANVRGQYIN
jgi:hypothetical protein